MQWYGPWLAIGLICAALGAWIVGLAQDGKIHLNLAAFREAPSPAKQTQARRCYDLAGNPLRFCPTPAKTADCLRYDLTGNLIGPCPSKGPE